MACISCAVSKLCFATTHYTRRFFYQGQLLDGAGVDAVSKGAPFHTKLALGPMVVWDCQDGRERGGGSGGRGGSLQNHAEAQLAATLVGGEVLSCRSVCYWTCISR